MLPCSVVARTLADNGDIDVMKIIFLCITSCEGDIRLKYNVRRDVPRTKGAVIRRTRTRWGGIQRGCDAYVSLSLSFVHFGTGCMDLPLIVKIGLAFSLRPIETPAY